MRTFTERGANSSSINLMNSSTRLPEGDGMQKPRTGSILSAGPSAAARFIAPTSSRQSKVFIGVVSAINPYEVAYIYFLRRFCELVAKPSQHSFLIIDGRAADLREEPDPVRLWQRSVLQSFI